MRSIIVGTAGHIDHGKSALVRALTGTDPDRLPEEKKRGITIDLGFADLALEDLRIGFVDVPGHERFVKNMLAGAHGIDVLALVIAGDEGVMPQTREHFDICRLLGVCNGLIVITKKDLVEDEMLMLVEDEARELTKGSFLEGSPIVSVSARTRAGLPELEKALADIARKVAPRSAELVTRLPVDRAFSMKGFGPVVTGTLVSGAISEGDELELLPARLDVRVRGLQMHGHAVTHAYAGQRTAVNLAGIDVDQIHRGMVLSPAGRLRPTQMMDVSLDVLPNAPRAIRSRARIRLHIGTAEVLGRIRVLQEPPEIEPGKSGLAQVRLESPIVAVLGDRFILRTYAPAATIAGGVVLDAFATKHRAKDLAAVRGRLNRLMTASPETKLATIVEATREQGLRFADLVAATGWKDEVVTDLSLKAKTAGALTEAGGVFMAPEYFARLGEQMVAELEKYHKSNPLSRGMLRETLRERLFAHAFPELFSAVVVHLERSGKIVAEKDTVRASEHMVGLSDADAQLREMLEDIYLRAGVEAPSVDEVMTKAGVQSAQRAHGRKILQLLLDRGALLRIQGEMFMHAAAVEALKRKLLDHAAQGTDRLIDVATFKDLAGVSRKYAIPLLEFFDRERITRRAGDKRLILPPSAELRAR